MSVFPNRGLANRVYMYFMWKVVLRFMNIAAETLLITNVVLSLIMSLFTKLFFVHSLLFSLRLVKVLRRWGVLLLHQYFILLRLNPIFPNWDFEYVFLVCVWPYLRLFLNFKSCVGIKHVKVGGIFFLFSILVKQRDCSFTVWS